MEVNILLGTVFLASKLEGKKNPYSLVLLYAGAAKGIERGLLFLTMGISSLST